MSTCNQASMESLQIRKVTDVQRMALAKKLTYLKMVLNDQFLKKVRVANAPMFTPIKFAGAFGDPETKQILQNCENIFSAADLFKFFNIWYTNVANGISFAFSKVFKDIDVKESENETELDNVKDISFHDIFDFDEQDSLLTSVEGEHFAIAENSLLEDVEVEYDSE